MRRDLFYRLPSATALLLVSSLLSLAPRAEALSPPLPRRTVTLEYHVIDAVAWPLLPTPPPLSPAELNELRRRQDLNTICGFIGGDGGLPATCSAGSHCVLDQEHGAVGCCPNGGACTTGVFTGCVDFKSGPQTIVNPYVFTCAGSDVCYKNVFDGGFSQFGCGTATDLATSVATSADILTAPLPLTTLSVPFTEEPTTLATPTTINPSTGTRPFTSTLESSTSSSRSTSSRSTTSASTTTSASRTSTLTSSATSATNTQTEAPPASGSGGVDRTGAIIGGTISGVAILIALIAVGVYLWRRKRGNIRQGPGQLQSQQYISPVSGGPQFAPLYPNAPAAYNQNTGQYYTQYGQYGYGNNGAPYGQAANVPSGQPGPAQAPLSYHPTYAYPAAVAGATAAGGAVAVGARRPEAPDEVPLTREIDDFSQSFNAALGRIGEEDDPNAGNGVNGNGMNNNGYNNGGSSGAGSSEDSSTPLWQQNRRQSRNLMWQ